MTDSPIPQGAMDAAQAIADSEFESEIHVINDDCTPEIGKVGVRNAIARIIAAHTVDPAELEHLRGCIRAMQDKKKKRSNRISNQRTCIKRQEKKLAERKAEIATIAKQRNELIMAVETKCPGETRHQTALRYIREAEAHSSGPAMMDAAVANAKKEPNDEADTQA